MKKQITQVTCDKCKKLMCQEPKNSAYKQVGFLVLPAAHLKETHSLDRIDSKIGYEISNVQWVHKDVNLMKNSFNQEYFLQLCKIISEHRKEDYGH